MTGSSDGTHAHRGGTGEILRTHRAATSTKWEITDSQILLDGEPVNVDIVRSGTPELFSILFGGQSRELLVTSDRFNYNGLDPQPAVPGAGAG